MKHVKNLHQRETVTSGRGKSSNMSQRMVFFMPGPWVSSCFKLAAAMLDASTVIELEHWDQDK